VSPDELRLGLPQQLFADLLAARRRQHEEFVDLRREPEVLEAEDIDREQVADGLALHARDPAAAEARVGEQARELAGDARRIEARDVLEDPILLDERYERRDVRGRDGPDLGAHGRSQSATGPRTRRNSGWQSARRALDQRRCSGRFRTASFFMR